LQEEKAAGCPLQIRMEVPSGRPMHTRLCVEEREVHHGVGTVWQVILAKESQ
jgi:hypothetical protein